MGIIRFYFDLLCLNYYYLKKNQQKNNLLLSCLPITIKVPCITTLPLWLFRPPGKWVAYTPPQLYVVDSVVS
jgi:hypothetical protein